MGTLTATTTPPTSPCSTLPMSLLLSTTGRWYRTLRLTRQWLLLDPMIPMSTRLHWNSVETGALRWRGLTGTGLRWTLATCTAVVLRMLSRLSLPSQPSSQLGYLAVRHHQLLHHLVEPVQLGPAPAPVPRMIKECTPVLALVMTRLSTLFKHVNQSHAWIRIILIIIMFLMSRSHQIHILPIK